MATETIHWTYERISNTVWLRKYHTIASCRGDEGVDITTRLLDTYMTAVSMLPDALIHFNITGFDNERDMRELASSPTAYVELES